jgi:transposase
MSKLTRSSPEVHERSVPLPWEHEKDHPSSRAAVKSIAGKGGCSAEALWSWMIQP